MEQVFQITSLCVTASILALVIRRGAPELSLLLTLGTVAVGMLFLMRTLDGVLAFLKELEQRSGVSAALFLPLYKTIGIALIVQVGTGLCRDAGESALATVVETAGALCAVLVSLPLLRAVLSVLLELIE